VTDKERFQAIAWFKTRIENTPMPGAKKMFSLAVEALENKDALDEWCTDCKEYDKEKHCCPRFTKVIRETLKEIKEKETT